MSDNRYIGDFADQQIAADLCTLETLGLDAPRDRDLHSALVALQQTRSAYKQVSDYLALVTETNVEIQKLLYQAMQALDPASNEFKAIADFYLTPLSPDPIGTHHE